jgi:hypothetical protein
MSAPRVDLNGKLRLHGSFSHSVVHVGSERAPVVVIDNFLSDPAVLVDYAATNATFATVADTFYPGVRAPIPPIYSFAVRAFLGEIIAHAFGLEHCRVVKEKADFSLVTRRPEELQVLQRLPHFDNTDDKQLAVLHYLCPARHGGTSFYRHRATGFESIRPDRLAHYKARVTAELATQGPPSSFYINGDTPMFERVASFDAAFNRMLIYRSISLHSADIARDFGYDAEPRTGRLTANTFYFFG